MCPECDGLGELYTFDPDLLIPDREQSFKQGCFELIGPWNDLGRWRRHIYQGVADTLERKHRLDAGTLLETPWDELDAELQQHLAVRHRRRAHHVHLAARRRRRMKYGGTFEGIVPELLDEVPQLARAACSAGSSKSTCA